MFKDRQQAGQLLAKKVLEILQMSPDFSSAQCVVIALPRGGVPAALEVAKILNCPLDILVSKKISAPGNPELGIGAVCSRGEIVLDERLARYTGASDEYIEEQKQFLVEATRAKETSLLKLSGLAHHPDIRSKYVVVVDDGVAVGVTAAAALRSLRKGGAAKVVLAVPVAAAESARRLRAECDCVIAILNPENLISIGQFYTDFTQVSDEEVVAFLKEANELCLIKQN